MNISDADSIARLVPNRSARQLSTMHQRRVAGQTRADFAAARTQSVRGPAPPQDLAATGKPSVPTSPRRHVLGPATTIGGQPGVHIGPAQQGRPGGAQVEEPKTRLDALLADWGKEDSPYDLNGDGKVGIHDMLMLLKQMANEMPPNGAPAGNRPTGRPVPVPGRPDGSRPVPGRPDGSRPVPGRPDGSRPVPGRPDGSRPVPGRPDGPLSTRPVPGRPDVLLENYYRASADNIARTLLPQMSTTEPGELRESIRGSNLPDAQKRFVLDRLATWHPHGHHLKVVG